MLKPNLETALNEQINHEFAASFSYLAVTAYMESQSLGGFASWFHKQHQEEQAHAQRLFNYVIDRGGTVKITAIPEPKQTYDSPSQAFELGLKMERENTQLINDLYALAIEEKDFATQSHLQWFLDEQVEEEKNFEDAIALLDRFGDDPSGLLILNDQFGNRSGNNAEAPTG